MSASGGGRHRAGNWDHIGIVGHTGGNGADTDLGDASPTPGAASEPVKIVNQLGARSSMELDVVVRG